MLDPLVVSERASSSRQMTQISGDGMSLVAGKGVVGSVGVGRVGADTQARCDELASIRFRD